MKTYKFRQNDSVQVVIDGKKVKGKIVGAATEELPVIGRMYIIKTDPNNGVIPNEHYPFDTISFQENLIDNFDELSRSFNRAVAAGVIKS